MFVRRRLFQSWKLCSGLPAMDSQWTRLHLHFASTKSSTFVWLARSQFKINVGRRGTNQLRLVERYLDVLAKHTTEIPPPTALVEGTAPSALVEGVSLRWFILSCEYLISLNQIHAHTCYQLHRGNGDDLSLDRPDPWGTEDRPQSQAPLSYSIAAPSDHN